MVRLDDSDPFTRMCRVMMLPMGRVSCGASLCIMQATIWLLQLGRVMIQLDLPLATPTCQQNLLVEHFMAMLHLHKLHI